MSTQRKFGFNPSNLATVTPVLPSANYAGIITNASIKNKDGTKKFIAVVQDQEWNDTTKSFDLKDNWVLKGSIFFQGTLTSKKAIQILQRDEPRVFGGQIAIVFDNEKFLESGEENPNYLQPDSKKNIALTNFIIGAGLGTKDANENLESEFLNSIQVDYEEATEADIPEGAEGQDGILDLLTAANYYNEYFAQVCELANGQQAIFNVIKQKNRTSGSDENVINCNFGRLAGIIPYKDGAEFDLKV